MTRTLSIAAVALIALGGAAFIYFDRPGVELPPLGVGEAQAQAQDEASDTGEADTPAEYVLGDPEAPATLVEYASFTCPHCASFHTGPFKQLKRDYIDTGKLKLVYREVYFDRFGLWAAMVARCGGEERYFGIVELLYEQQKQWIDGADASEIVDNLRRLGKTAGLTDEELDACLRDQSAAEAMVAAYQENVSRDGVEATPSFVIGGTTYRNMGYDELTRLIDAELPE